MNEESLLHAARELSVAYLSSFMISILRNSTG